MLFVLKAILALFIQLSNLNAYPFSIFAQDESFIFFTFFYENVFKSYLSFKGSINISYNPNVIYYNPTNNNLY